MNLTRSNNENIELEDHFILRLPQAEADYIRTQLSIKPKRVKKRLKLDLDVQSGYGTTFVAGKALKGRLRKLPTIIESLRSDNKATFTKTADICHVFDCINPEGPLEMRHGVVPPLKNVRKRRFRKSLVQNSEPTVNVQKELSYLLQADLEAVSTSFQVFHEKTVDEVGLFGNVLTDSEETDSNIEEI